MKITPKSRIDNILKRYPDSAAVLEWYNLDLDPEESQVRLEDLATDWNIDLDELVENLQASVDGTWGADEDDDDDGNEDDDDDFDDGMDGEEEEEEAFTEDGDDDFEDDEDDFEEGGGEEEEAEEPETAAAPDEDE